MATTAGRRAGRPARQSSQQPPEAAHAFRRPREGARRRGASPRRDEAAHAHRHRRMRQDTLRARARRAFHGRHPDGVWFVDLAPLTDASLVAEAIAARLSVREAPGKTVRELLLEHVANKRLLLVLDNCEHVLTGGGRARRHAVGGERDAHDSRHQPRRARRRGRASIGVAIARFDAVDRDRRPRRSSCSSIARASPPRLPPDGARTPAPSRKSAAGSMASRSRSSWRPRASRCSRSIRSGRSSTTASGCSPAAGSPPCLATRRCRRRSSGATTSSRRTSRRSSARSRCSQAAGPWISSRGFTGRGGRHRDHGSARPAHRQVARGRGSRRTRRAALQPARDRASVCAGTIGGRERI